MTNRLKHNLLTAFIYSGIVYVLLMPFKMLIVGIGVSIIIGFFLGMLNDILIQLRKMNGEVFPNIEDVQKNTHTPPEPDCEHQHPMQWDKEKEVWVCMGCNKKMW